MELETEMKITVQMETKTEKALIKEIKKKDGNGRELISESKVAGLTVNLTGI
jgi:hypothetical protein